MSVGFDSVYPAAATFAFSFFPFAFRVPFGAPTRCPFTYSVPAGSMGSVRISVHAQKTVATRATAGRIFPDFYHARVTTHFPGFVSVVRRGFVHFDYSYAGKIGQSFRGPTMLLADVFCQKTP